LRLPDGEEDLRDSSCSVSHRLVLELFEPGTGIGSSMPVSAGADILPYAVVIPCVNYGTTEHEHMRFRADIKSTASLLPLSRSTRAVLCIPACTPETFKVSKDTARLQHSCYMSRGCPFYCLGREEGYPPRVAYMKFICLLVHISLHSPLRIFLGYEFCGTRTHVRSREE
jgi:hypothetical protein